MAITEQRIWELAAEIGVRVAAVSATTPNTPVLMKGGWCSLEAVTKLQTLLIRIQEEA